MVTTPVPPTPVIRMFQGCVERRQLRHRQRRRVPPCSAAALRFLRSSPPCTVTKLGQKPLTQEIVLVAVGLVDLALAAELGLHRQHRHAVRLHAAVAAAFADQRVDQHALGGIGHLAALAAAALLGRAGLVVDQDGDARHLAQVASAPSSRSLRSMNSTPRREDRRAWSTSPRSSLTTTMRLHAFGGAPGARSAAPSACRRPAGRRSSRPRRCRGSCR